MERSITDTNQSSSRNKTAMSLLARVFRRNVERVRIPGVDRPLMFHAESPVERYRTRELGGERELLEMFVQTLRKDDVVWDIGSNIGTFSLAAATQVVHGQVIAFEPDPEIARRVAQNADMNKLSNVRVVQCALGDRQGTGVLYTDGLRGYSPGLRKKSHQRAASGELAIDIRTIDQLVQSGEIRPANVVKIDVEGAELLVLKGMSAALQDTGHIRTIFIELHTKFILDFGGTIEECEALLRESEFKCTSRLSRFSTDAGEEEIHLIWSR